MNTLPFRSLLILVSTIALAGCGGSDLPELVPLTGTVSLAGKPLKDAQVLFQPEGGRPSFAYTDEDGEFELHYMEGTPGVKAGPGKIAISTAVEPDPDSDDPARQQGRKEQAPAVVTTVEKTPIKVDAKEGLPALNIKLDDYR